MPDNQANQPVLELNIGKHGQWMEVLQRFTKNKTALVGLIIVVVLFLAAVFPQIFTSLSPYDQDFTKMNNSPSAEHIFGTDGQGRDVYTRVVYGARTSLTIGLVTVSIACFVGVLLGSISGYYSGAVDNIFMRLIDIIMAIPNTMLAMSIMAALGQSLPNLIIALGIGQVPAFARLVRVSVQSVKEQEYVEAAISTGANDFRIITKYILPNCMAPIIVQFTMGIATAILNAAGLSFLGLGVPPPTPEWGAMASAARNYIRDYWWIITFPGLAIMVTAFSFNSLGDGLRDALDPKLKE